MTTGQIANNDRNWNRTLNFVYFTTFASRQGSPGRISWGHLVYSQILAEKIEQEIHHFFSTGYDMVIYFGASMHKSLTGIFKFRFVTGCAFGS